jgi:hypothetical protein
MLRFASSTSTPSVAATSATEYPASRARATASRSSGSIAAKPCAGLLVTPSRMARSTSRSRSSRRSRAAARSTRSTTSAAAPSSREAARAAPYRCGARRMSSFVRACRPIRATVPLPLPAAIDRTAHPGIHQKVDSARAAWKLGCAHTASPRALLVALAAGTSALSVPARRSSPGRHRRPPRPAGGSLPPRLPRARTSASEHARTRPSSAHGRLGRPAGVLLILRYAACASLAAALGG